MNLKNNQFNKLFYLALMCIFGCLGPVVRNIGLPSSVIVCLRAWIAAASLFIYILLTKKRWSKAEIIKQLKPMLVSGFLLAFDWIGLFSSYNYTTIATATVTYYLASVFVIIGAVLFLREKMSVKSAICIVTAFAGMVFVSGAAENGLPKFSEIKGVLLALVGALAYAFIILINKKNPDGDPLLRTVIQLAVAAAVMTPYILLTNDVSSLSVSPKGIMLLLLLGVGMTAITYIFYFSLIVKIPSRTVALFSYADPVVAVFISLVFLAEPISFFGVLGSLMIIGSAIVSEL